MEKDEIEKLGGKILELDSRIENNPNVIYYDQNGQLRVFCLQSTNAVNRKCGFTIISNDLPNIDDFASVRSHIKGASYIFYDEKMVYNKKDNYIVHGNWENLLASVAKVTESKQNLEGTIDNDNILQLFEVYIRNIVPIDEETVLDIGDNIKIIKAKNIEDCGNNYDVYYCGEHVLSIFQETRICFFPTMGEQDAIRQVEKSVKINLYEEGIWENLLVNYFEYISSQKENKPNNILNRSISKLFRKK